MTELSSQYQPKSVEDRWYPHWETRGYFHATPPPEGVSAFTIVIPPPNVTGILHMGHALNNTIQDVLVRWQRMTGAPTLWVPGVDHAGIATQNVVEKQLAKAGKTRDDLGREAFVQRVWQWKEEYGGTIVRQLRRLGASCDWRRERFTMDAGLSRAVREVFVRLYDKGLVYRGNRIVNWCPRCQTALSDEEAPHVEMAGKLYYIRYPLASVSSFKFQVSSSSSTLNLKHETRNYIVVATTRPETLLGDQAVAVHPKDRRFKALVGQSVRLPLTDRTIPIVADEMVDRKFGTGAVKITPAHDPNDFAFWKRHYPDNNPPPLDVMEPDGRMNAAAGSAYAGMDRFACRKKVLEDLQTQGLLEKVDEHQHAVGHCYRCHTVVEPRLSPQWFVKMQPLAAPAIAAVKTGKVKFHPPRWKKVYLNWMTNIQDWCISRQIWWGHRIPVWYCNQCAQGSGLRAQGGLVESPATGIIVATDPPTRCPDCGGPVRQDEDVLDTWFSSWLWPFSTLGWPEETADLKAFYPTSVLVTAPEIIFFWVARMIMAGCAFMGREPFSDVYIHGTVRDISGKKMSKSLGNIIDPVNIIEQVGADALRFSLMAMTATGTDVFLSKEQFHLGRNFANKLWNAGRFILAQPMTVSSFKFQVSSSKPLSLADRWILSRLQDTTADVTNSLKAYNFNDAANRLYEFIWHDFCDWYVELVKPHVARGSGLRAQGESLASAAPSPQSPAQSLPVLLHVFETSLRLLHPYMPYITEELWQHLRGSEFRVPSLGLRASAIPDSIMLAPWPKAQRRLMDAEAERRIGVVQAVIKAVRELRLAYHLPPGREMAVAVAVPEADVAWLREALTAARRLAWVGGLQVAAHLPQPKHSVVQVVGGAHVYLMLEGVDVGQETGRLRKELASAQAAAATLAARLADATFRANAPAEVVAREEARQAELQAAVEKLQHHITALATL